MTFDDLILIMRQDYLDDAEVPYLWLDVELLRYLREAEKQACTRGNLLFDNTTAEVCSIALSNGVQSYVLSSKLTQITDVFWNGNRLTHKAYENMDEVFPTWRVADSSGMQNKELFYVIQGRNISIAPIPNAADALLGALKIEGYRLPISDVATSPEILEEFHHDLVYYALYKAYSKNDSDTKAEIKAKQYLDYFDMIFGPEVTARVRQHQFEQPRRGYIRPTASLSAFASEGWE